MLHPLELSNLYEKTSIRQSARTRRSLITNTGTEAEAEAWPEGGSEAWPEGGSEA